MGAHARRPKRRRGVWSTISGVVGGALIVGGVVLGGAAAVAPQAVEKAYGEVKVAVNDVTTAASGDLPTVRLGPEGGEKELDRCDGTFTGMLSYRNTVGVPPVYAAHNGCQGDVILNWEVGTQLHIEGRTEVYEVVEVRNTKKKWETTEALIGLQGEFALQTCYYGEDKMRFVGLVPVGEQPAPETEIQEAEAGA